MLQEKVAQPGKMPRPEEIAVEGFDHIEFYVGNALQASYYYGRGFGFDLIAYRGLETGHRDEVSYVMKQDHVNLVLTGSLRHDGPAAEHVRQHGDGVKTIALKVNNARLAYETAIKRGAKKIGEFEEYEGPDGIFRMGAVATYGETVHKFIERREFKGAF